MSEEQLKKGVISSRLMPEQYANIFCDLHAPLSDHEAIINAQHCYFCYDAPCQSACPADIDIALFIREISTSNALGAAKTIFDKNIFGAMCARVCPVETLCEEACVRQQSENEPVRIGQLQRYATDLAINNNKHFYKRGAVSGKKIAIVGAGPAGISCAHQLAIFGHEVEIFEAQEKSGGLNEYGIAAYKATDRIAQKEIDYILQIGGIKINHNQILGRDFTLKTLSDNYDAVFLAIGLGGVNELNIKGEDATGVQDAIEFISELRQSKDLAKIPIGQNVVVIGGGMSAIDVAIQAKLLGAQNVTICYRRGKEQMGASIYEQELATSKGVVIKHWLVPTKIKTKDGNVKSIKLEYSTLVNGKLTMTGEKTTLKADQVFKAIGQNLITDNVSELKLEQGRIMVDKEFRTSNSKIFAGGDCIYGGEDLTVSAAANGRDAAIAINQQLLKGAK